MDGGAFEQFVLRVVEAHGRAVTPAELAAMMGVPVRTAERALGHLAEAGVLKARANRDGEAEFYLGRRASKPSAAEPGAVPDPAVAFAAPGSPLMAVLLSLMVPGAGHVYAGRTGAGVAWMAGTLAGYACCLVPGLLLHGLCLVSAAQRRGY